MIIILMMCKCRNKIFSEKSAFMDRILSRASAVVFSGVGSGIPHLLCEQVY